VAGGGEGDMDPQATVPQLQDTRKGDPSVAFAKLRLQGTECRRCLSPEASKGPSKSYPK